MAPRSGGRPPKQSGGGGAFGTEAADVPQKRARERAVSSKGGGALAKRARGSMDTAVTRNLGITFPAMLDRETIEQLHAIGAIDWSTAMDFM